MSGKVAEIVSIREKTEPSSLDGSAAANPDLPDGFHTPSLISPTPDQNPLQTGKRIESGGKIKQPGFSGNGKKAEVGRPGDGGEGGNGHAWHLQLPRQQRQHQELAAIVEQPEVSLKIFRWIYHQKIHQTLKSSKVSAPQWSTCVAHSTMRMSCQTQGDS